MNKTTQFETQTKELIDGLKGICASYGLGNDGNEFKIITQVFLYKYINDKFASEVKSVESKYAIDDQWEEKISKLSDDDYEMILLQLSPDTARLFPRHYITHLFERQNESDFAELFDDTLRDIAIVNNDIFAVQTGDGTKITLFDRVSQYITNPSQRDDFCKALINQLVEFSFEHIFDEKYDFFATIFEYLIKDYNKDGGGKYAEYYTPHAVAKIMAAVLVDKPVQDVTCYDPSAGSGTLLMNLAHAIGEDRCTIYSQDISQKSSALLRLNLILNNLVHSIQNIIQGNTIKEPAFRDKKFDFIVSNPPFKLDFSDYSADLDTDDNRDRFFAGIPNLPKKAKDKMAIYNLFTQHIMHSLNATGKAAIVLPTGFITAQSGIDKKIRKKLVDNKWLSGVISMPSNIFATTGTNVSILFLDKSNTGKVVLMDASSLGEKVKDGKNQKTVLTKEEEDRIIDTFNNRITTDDFSVAVSYDQITKKNYSLSAGQYFEIKIEHVEISQNDFAKKVLKINSSLNDMFSESKDLEIQIIKSIKSLGLE